MLSLHSGAGRCLLLLASLYCVMGDMNFIAMGDWGSDNDLQHHVAKTMGTTASQIKSEFTLALGDNFYSSGIHGPATDPRFKKTFEDVYTAPSLQSTWYVIAGNHDHGGNVSAQIAYSQLSKRWHYPDYYYQEVVTMKSDNEQEADTTVQLIMIDTVILGGDWSNNEDQPLGAPDQAAADKQLEWLESTLKNSTADWVFVGGHYPVWSVAEHGPTKTLVSQVKPLLEKYKVAAYWNGHDHNLQHLVDTDVDYWVTGNGGQDDSSEAHKSDVPKDSLKFFHHNGGFMGVNLNSTHYTGTLYDINGKNIYTHTSKNPKAKRN